MATLLDQIQRDCVNQDVPVSTLLRRVKLAASKLGLQKVEDWVDSELTGYTTDVPDYRVMQGQLVEFEPLRGWWPVAGNTEKLSRQGVGESISALEAHLANSNGQVLILRMGNKKQDLLRKLTSENDATFGVRLSTGQMTAAIDRVRTLVLDWANRLEKAGIVGTEFSFSGDEKHKAQAMTKIEIGSIGNFTGILGNENTSGDISNSSLDLQAISALVKDIRKLDLKLLGDAAPSKKLLAVLETAIESTPSDTPRIRALLDDLRSSVTGAAGNLLASGILFQLNKILGA